MKKVSLCDSNLTFNPKKFRQLDSRLTKAPAKTKGLATNNKGTKTTNAADVDEITIQMAIRQNSISAGKAIPYAAVTIKNHGNDQIEVSILSN